jgi:hypothetical protein
MSEPNCYRIYTDGNEQVVVSLAQGGVFLLLIDDEHHATSLYLSRRDIESLREALKDAQR